MGAGWGMLEYLVLAIVCLNLLFCVWMLRVITLELHNAISQIDSLMAQAIQGLVEKGLGDFEPINPIQAAIANMLTQNLTKPDPGSAGSVIDVELTRDASGKFS
jgi:hypothetical protein